MKKIYSFCTITLCLLGIFLLTLPAVKVSANSTKPLTYEDFTYTIFDEDGKKEIWLSSYTGTKEHVVLPEEINSMKVT